MKTDSLFELTKDLIQINSVSGNEKQLVDKLENHLKSFSHLKLTRISNTLVAECKKPETAQIILAGHVDTVPPASNETVKIVGNTLYGLGACDMKGGIAVMIKLAESAKDFNVSTRFIFYESEEVEINKNGLQLLSRRQPELLKADGAILLEPTNSQLELGCQGVLLFNIQVKGVKAHAARPWKGVNSITRAPKIIESVKSFPKKKVMLEGVCYKESLEPVKFNSGSATNVIPDLAEITLSYRFAPDKSADIAQAEIFSHFKHVLDNSLGDNIVILEARNGAYPASKSGIFKQLFELTSNKVSAKLGWTDVAFFSENQTVAVNFGPGDPQLAHSPDEKLEKGELEQSYKILTQFLKSI